MEYNYNDELWDDHCEYFAQLHITKTRSRSKWLAVDLHGLGWRYDTWAKSYRAATPPNVDYLEKLAVETAQALDEYKPTTGKIVMSYAHVLKQQFDGWTFSGYGAYVLEAGEVFETTSYDIRARHKLKPYRNYITKSHKQRKKVNQLITEDCALTLLCRREITGCACYENEDGTIYCGAKNAQEFKQRAEQDDGPRTDPDYLAWMPV